MKPNTEKKYRLNLSWDYENEEKWMNEQSARGLHLRKPGFLSSTFVRDEAVRYTYCLDYQAGLTKKNGKLQEYIELYRDAGWEYVTSYGGIWHYFRKEWEPGEVPRLYSDRDSLAAHYKKIQSMMGVMLLLNIGLCAINMANLLPRGHQFWGVVFPLAAIYIFLFALLLVGYLKMGSKINKLTK
ncbi:DUF2812 domain-containing protein [Paenibacillus sp. BC26]|uniref:DUF2812 domain-containing protein n=1 Tax=Paenibacillus sp. BC26 TaxID=1881032 RepID=UPI0008EA5E65|nr:DUF2812 domain-containing protein [Paenibacillus sp. BC26]SFT28150.1 Protein of unknown function [Paenibacillus sp. BC26]